MVDIYVGEENTRWTLHEKLLCHRSKFFRNIFYNKDNKAASKKMYGLPDDDDEPFKLFVGWLYSEAIPTPSEEKDLGPLFDLYLMGEKWEIRKLIVEVLDAVRKWYHESDTWPSLRRVQYIYSNTEEESAMRQLLVSCVARMLVLGEGVPVHWEKALRRNGQLAVDIILCVQKWKFEPQNVPDARDASVVPFQEEAEQKVEEKQNEEGGEEPEAEDEAEEEAEEEAPETNGVDGEEHEQEQEQEQE